MVEHNYGQMLREVQRTAGGACPVDFIGRINGTVIPPQEILEKIEEAFEMPSDLIYKYMRIDHLPHIWCAGCGNGTLTRDVAVAIDELCNDPDERFPWIGKRWSSSPASAAPAAPPAIWILTPSTPPTAGP
jgi:hypothetical protein